MTPERRIPGGRGRPQPAAVRGPDGELYLFRDSWPGNYSRIGVARSSSMAMAILRVERLGVALEPETEYEKRPDGGAAAKTPGHLCRAAGKYVMTYTAFSPPARASPWRCRTTCTGGAAGLARFGRIKRRAGRVDDKTPPSSPSSSPTPPPPQLPCSTGRSLPRPCGRERRSPATGWSGSRSREHLDLIQRLLQEGDGPRLGRFTSHHRLAAPLRSWERLKIGVGTPPVLTRHGWMVIYHGVSERRRRPRTEVAPLLGRRDVLSSTTPRDPLPIAGSAPRPGAARGAPGTVVMWCSPPASTAATISARRPLHVYYGMADDRIGVARLDVPEQLPECARRTRVRTSLWSGLASEPATASSTEAKRWSAPSCSMRDRA